MKDKSRSMVLGSLAGREASGFARPLSCLLLICKCFFTANSVFMTDAPPPYPGINGYSSGGYLGAGGFVSPPGPLSGGAQGGATGYTANAPNAKAAEAAGLQTGYVDPNNPQMAYLPQV